MNPAFVLWWLSPLFTVLSLMINYHLFRVMRNGGKYDGSLIGDAL